jgi:hypothetical protein
MTDSGGGTWAGGGVGAEEVSLLLHAANTDTAASTDVFRMTLDDLLRICFRDLAMFILCL